MIRTHPHDPPLTTREAAQITAITTLAAVRGEFTTAQKRRIDNILDGARTRAAKTADKK